MKTQLLFSTALIASAATAQAVVLVSIDGADAGLVTNYATYAGTVNTWMDPSDGVFMSPAAPNYKAAPFYGFRGGRFTPESTGITENVATVGAIVHNINPQYLTATNPVPTENGLSQNLLLPLFELDTAATEVESLDFRLRGYGTSGPTVLRAVVQVDNSTYYISDDLGSSNGLKDLTSTSWFDFSPSTDVWTVGSSASFDGTGNITGLGIWLSEQINFTGTQSGAGVGTSLITFNGTAVPEPSTYAMIAGAAMLGFAAWRRRKR